MVSHLITLALILVSLEAQSLVPYLIYSNDIEKNIKSNVNFADDTMLFSVVNNPAISANELNHDLKVISQWVYQWKIKFKPDLNKQATELLFSCKKNSINHQSLFFNESVVPKVKEQEHLGLTLDSKFVLIWIIVILYITYQP